VQQEEVKAGDQNPPVSGDQSPKTKLLEHLTKQADVSDSEESHSDDIAFPKTDDKEDEFSDDDKVMHVLTTDELETHFKKFFWIVDNFC
jgi:hypothetical protein